MSKKILINGKIYEETTSLKTNIGGAIFEETTTGTALPVAVNDTYSVTVGQTLNVSAPGVLNNDTYTCFPFIFIMRTTADPETVTLPATGTNNFDVDWGDGSNVETVTTASPTHEYDTADDYTITISGTCPKWYFNGGGDKLKIIKVLELGKVGWTDLINGFLGCSNMTEFKAINTDTSNVENFDQFLNNLSALTSFDISGMSFESATTMDRAFRNFTSLATTPDLSGLFMPLVEDMYAMMYSWTDITTAPDVSNFDAGAVLDMRFALSTWTAMGTMDLDIDLWDIGSLTNAASFLFGNTLTTACYDRTLIAWEGQTHNNNVTAHFGGSKYTDGGTAKDARDALVADGWSITDSGPV